MEKYLLSESGPEVSAAIYGFWRWEKELQDTALLTSVVEECQKLGITSFDLNNPNGTEEVEKSFGKLLKACVVKRSDVVIAARAGWQKNRNTGKLYADLSQESIRSTVDQLLKNLGTDYVDVLLLHDFDPLFNAEETASVLTDLVLKRKIRYIGLSNFNVFQHKLLSAHLSIPVVTNHIELSVLQTDAIRDGRLDLIREQYSKPLALAPLAGGRILTGTDARTTAIRSLLAETAARYSANVEQLAVAWLYKLQALPIIGSLDLQRIRNAASAHTIELSNEDWHLIYEFVKS